MIPRHDNPTMMRYDRRSRTEFWAYASYNFIPLPEKVVCVDSIPAQDIYSDNTGYIECLMTVESLLYTRCGMSPDFFSEYGDVPFHDLPDEKKKERANFFHLNNSRCPLIPGSSLRGMVRALIEIAGYGKVQWVTDNNLVFRAVGEGGSLGTYYRSKLLGPQQRRNGKWWFDYPLLSVRGGYLRIKNSQWWIQPARDINGETFVHVEYSAANCGKHDPQDDYNSGDIIDIYIKPPAGRTEPWRSNRELTLRLAIVSKASDVNKTSKPKGFEKAVLVRSGHMEGRNEKHMHCAIYEPDDNAEWIQIPASMRALYEEDRNMTRGYKTRPLKHDGDPLFYLIDDQNQLVFFGPTMMFRLPYDRPMIDFVPDRLRNPNDIDLADAIFGYTGGENNTARAGRVFFTDAVLESAASGVWSTEEPITPKVLSSPKPTSFQHYLVQDRLTGHDPDNRDSLAHYDTPSPDETVIRGTKMYWHKGDISLDDLRADPEDVRKSKKQYTSIKPVNTGVAFIFRIYFDNLCNYELGALLWVLTLPGREGKQYRHRLGMGKPFGMGAVRIEPKLHISDRDKRYAQLFYGRQWAEPTNEGNMKSYVEAFEQYVLKASGYDGKTFSEIERIQMLLAMMEWPGPDPGLTKYLESMPVNEYKHRPVLPDPLNISPP